MLKLYVNGVQFGRAKNLTDVVEQIVCRRVAYVEKQKDGYNIVTYGRGAESPSDEAIEKRRSDIDCRFCRNRRRPQRFRLWIDSEYTMCYPTLDDFIFSLLNVHVIYIEVHGTQVWMETAKKYGSEKRTMALCHESLEYHTNRVKARLDRYSAKKEKMQCQEETTMGV